MARIKAFRAMRYDTAKAGEISTLTCPPYDIISEEQRAGYIDANEYNIVRLELPAGENRYEKAGETLDEYLGKGVLAIDDTPGIYIYGQEFEFEGQKKQLKGIVTLVGLEEFHKGIILPHEETLSKAKADRYNLMHATGCNFSQIYSLYSDPSGSIAKSINAETDSEPIYEFTDKEAVTHKLWKCENQTVIDQLVDQFADKKLYIADGHHRYETAMRYRTYLVEFGFSDDETHPGNYVMMILADIDNDELVVLPTHRIIHSLEEFSLADTLKKLSADFDINPQSNLDSAVSAIESLDKQGEKAFVIYSKDERGTPLFHTLTLKNKDAMKEIFPDASDAYRSLDVSVLHSVALEKAFGIDEENMAAQTNLRYTRSMSAALEAVDGGNADCCFLLNPTKVWQIRDVAAAGEKMPQKSTYFYPKIITGLVMNKIV